MTTNSLSISLNTPLHYPIELVYGLFYGDNGIDPFVIGRCSPKNREWGIPSSSWLLKVGGCFSLFCRIEMEWLSIMEKRFYSIKQDLPTDTMREMVSLVDKETGKPIYEQILVGMAPYGKLAIWLWGSRKTIIIKWVDSSETNVDMRVFRPLTPAVSLDDICDPFISHYQQLNKNSNGHIMSPRDLFDRYMQQFNYRYMVVFGHWDEEKKEWKEYEGEEVRPEFEYVEEALYDGTHDKLHDGGLMQYHQAGKPKKLALQWHIKKSVYSAYLWFDDLKIRAEFEQFYIKYPDSKMDFIFRIDTDKKVLQISFNCTEANQPIQLNDSAYQMIIFKSKFEYFRTPNYNQPRGAWVW